MKNKKIKTVIVGGVLAGAVVAGLSLGSTEDLAVEVVTPQDVKSYITVPTFNTPTGDLLLNDYALVNGGYVTHNAQGELQWFEGSPPKGKREVQETGFKRQTKFRNGTKVDLSEVEYIRLKDNVKR